MKKYLSCLSVSVNKNNPCFLISNEDKRSLHTTMLKENKSNREGIVQDVRRERYRQGCQFRRSVLLVLYRYNSTRVHVHAFFGAPVYKVLQ